MRKSMKSFLAVLVLATPLALTSCEGMFDDIFGEWSRPVPSTVVEDARVLGAAEAKGAIVTVTYTVGNTTYTAKFEKIDGDNYKLISNTQGGAGARAMTRSADPDVPTDVNDVNAPTLTIVSGKLVLVVKATDGSPLFEATMNIEGGEVVVTNTNFDGVDCTIGDMYINDKVAEIKNPELKAVTLKATVTLNGGTFGVVLNYSIKYSKENNETWADVITRYSTLSVADIKTEDNKITMQFTENFVKEALKERLSNADDNKAAAIVNAVSQMTFYLVYNNPFAMTARAMTRATDSYVKTTDVVGTQDTYYLTTNEPGD